MTTPHTIAEDYEDSDWAADEFSKTGFRDEWTGNEIAFESEVVVYTVVSAGLDPQGKLETLQPITTDGTKLLYEPQFMSLSSWEEVNDDITQATRRETAIQDQFSVCACAYCGSDIRKGELFILAVYGEVRLSTRTPNGMARTATFVDLDSTPTYMCLSCNIITYERVLVLWSTPPRQHQECEAGTRGRCWRHGCSAHEQTCDLSRRPYQPHV